MTVKHMQKARHHHFPEASLTESTSKSPHPEKVGRGKGTGREGPPLPPPFLTAWAQSEVSYPGPH